MSALIVKELESGDMFRDLNLYVDVAHDRISCGMLTVTNDFLRLIKEK